MIGEKVLALSHGMGQPSMAIFLHEVAKLMVHAKAELGKVKFLRMGTSGGLGVAAGTVESIFGELCVRIFFGRENGGRSFLRLRSKYSFGKDDSVPAFLGNDANSRGLGFGCCMMVCGVARLSGGVPLFAFALT